jgi:hypothetical protein
MAALVPRLLARLLRPLVGHQTSFYQAVLACFVIAGTLWMLRALNSSHVAALDYPIVWRYNAQRYHPARPLPATVQVEVRGNGWRLLSRVLHFHLPPAEVRLRLAGTPPPRSPLRPPLRRTLGTLKLVSLPTDSATFYLVPGAEAMQVKPLE